METFIETTSPAMYVNLSKVVQVQATSSGIKLILDNETLFIVDVPDIPRTKLAKAFFKAVDNTPRILVTPADIREAEAESRPRQVDAH